MFKKRFDSKRWGNLLAIWIKACNDEQPIMFYKSCKHNLNFESEDKIKQLILSNSELFRPLSQKTLDAYKAYYMGNLEKFPSRLVNGNETVQHAIERLETGSAFTSQFRRKPSAEKSSKETIEMGVNYISKKWELEVNSLETRDRYWGSLIIPALALIVAILTIIYKK